MTGSDTELAAELATTAGRLLLQLRLEYQATAAATGKDLAQAGDAAAQALLADRLTAERPADAVLSEEAVDDHTRLRRDRVWIVDPLDGTREYSEGRDDWAVHVALWERGRLSGAVALPAHAMTLDTTTVTAGDYDAPATGERGAPQRQPLSLAVSRSRASDLVLGTAERLAARLVPMGSAGYKVTAVVRGVVDAYLHSGGQYEWDSAAPVAVAQAAGLHVSRIDGAPLRYNQENPYLPDLLVCRPEIAGRVLTAVREVAAETLG